MVQFGQTPTLSQSVGHPCGEEGGVLCDTPVLDLGRRAAEGRGGAVGSAQPPRGVFPEQASTKQGQRWQLHQLAMHRLLESKRVLSWTVGGNVLVTVLVVSINWDHDYLKKNFMNMPQGDILSNSEIWFC